MPAYDLGPPMEQAVEQVKKTRLREYGLRGLPMLSVAVNFPQRDEEVRRTVGPLGEAWGVYKRGLEEGVEKCLVGRPVQPVFREHA